MVVARAKGHFPLTISGVLYKAIRYQIFYTFQTRAGLNYFKNCTIGTMCTILDTLSTYRDSYTQTRQQYFKRCRKEKWTPPQGPLLHLMGAYNIQMYALHGPLFQTKGSFQYQKSRTSLTLTPTKGLYTSWTLSPTKIAHYGSLLQLKWVYCIKIHTPHGPYSN